MLVDTLKLSAGRITAGLTLLTAAYLPFSLWGSLPHRALIADLLWVTSDLLAAAAIWLAARHPAMPRAPARAWTFIALGQLAYAVGDGIWGYLENRLGRDPFPSIADIFYLLFYPFMMAGMLLFPHAPQDRLGKWKFALDAGTVLVGGWMVVWYFVLGPTVRAGEEIVATAMAAAYPIGDLVLLFGAAALLLRAGRGTSRTGVALLAAGAFGFFLADTAFGYLAILERYEAGNWPDILYLLAGLAVAGGAVTEALAHAGGAREGLADEDRVAGSFLPHLAVALGYTVLLIAFLMARMPERASLTPLLSGAIAITLFVAGRQSITQHENARLVGQLRALARTDHLTGVLARGEFLRLAEREFARFRRHGYPLSVLMLDVDGFKRINDRYGHLTGDQALVHVARSLRLGLRETDLVGRFGGDEFVILLPDTGPDGAAATASRLRRQIGERPLIAGGQELRIEVSVGAASAQPASPTLDALLEEADRQMYAAKRTARASGDDDTVGRGGAFVPSG
ncbi:MAG: GGDEF domain-containing protein [Armatimonadota bacterium]|nr:GGDEF domain-containing protein [Armatimonadota bacterium]MDR7466678.1 GGDEF domain-containing protein [Armatimonadota bacterium]MDR7492848.1 GGDEF domain-containing protein [Armatimonadota bacterium]MDR7498624.1 GGDEF domain-containing protein [Armatimonadota bacterium]MDR7504588.1 GGDEF domain-containing protein [Armatimonadota bacterium]